MAAKPVCQPWEWAFAKSAPWSNRSDDRKGGQTDLRRRCSIPAALARALEGRAGSRLSPRPTQRSTTLESCKPQRGLRLTSASLGVRLSSPTTAVIQAAENATNTK